MGTAVQRMRGTTGQSGAGVRALALLLALLAPALARAEPYRLQMGDSLRLTVVGLTDASATAAVDTEGRANFLQFGVVDAAGRTVAEIQADVRGRIEGQVLKRYGDDGAPNFIAIAPEDVFVDVAAFQPVYVGGDVASPRAVDFRPGMTLRAAVASAGGTSRGAVPQGDDLARQTPRLQADFGSLALEHAGLVARLWRVEAALAGERDPAPPEPVGVSVGPDVFAEMLETQRRQLQVALERQDGQRAYLNAALVQAKERKRILEEQDVQQQQAVKDDEEEQIRVKALLERGVVQMTRVLDSRRALLLSSTRLLDTQNNLARVDLEITNFERQIVSLDEDSRRDLLQERDVTRQNMLQAAARLAGAREALELSGVEAIAPGAASGETALSFVLHRRSFGQAQSAVVDPDVTLLPGDVVEVIDGQIAPAIAP